MNEKGGGGGKVDLFQKQIVFFFFSALLLSQRVAESAVVGVPDEIKGESICCFVILKSHVREDTEETTVELVADLKVSCRDKVFILFLIVFRCPV